jgi:long-subunit fatty acid transport protein
MFGYDSSATGGANSEVAYGESYGVLYSNPALMSSFEPQTGVSVMFYKPSLQVNLMDRPSGTDVPLAIYDTNVSNFPHLKDRALPTVELEYARSDRDVQNMQSYLGAGMTYSFGIKGFRVGTVAVIPLIDVVQIQTSFPDEREQYFSNTVHLSRFGEWSPIIGGIVGTSYSPIKYISMGIGLQISATSIAGMGIYTPEATVQDYGLMNMDMKMGVKFRPIVGLQSEPADWISIGFTWRNESYIGVDAAGGLYLWNYHTTEFEDPMNRYTEPKRVKQQYKMVVDYEPMELAGALGFQYDGWKIQGVLTWNRWSNYRDHHGQRPEDAATFIPVNPGDILVKGDDYRWMDTLAVNVGTSYRYVDWAQTKVGFSYYPSPVPAQRGRTNYADSNLWCAALGQRFDFAVFEEKFSFELGFQFWQMLQRTTNKDPNQIVDEFADASRTILDNSPVTAAEGLQTNNPGFPGYTVKGWMLVTSATFNYQF